MFELLVEQTKSSFITHLQGVEEETKLLALGVSKRA